MKKSSKKKKIDLQKLMEKSSKKPLTDSDVLFKKMCRITEDIITFQDIERELFEISYGLVWTTPENFSNPQTIPGIIAQLNRVHQLLDVLGFSQEDKITWEQSIENLNDQAFSKAHREIAKSVN
jgi:hypothetical protein